jgi:hypothetical protein
MTDYALNPEASVAYFARSGGVISTNAFGAKPSRPQVKMTGSSLIAPWGDDNLFPQQVVDEASKNSILPSTIDWKARALYSNGIEHGYYRINEKKEIIFEPIQEPRVLEFFKRSRITRYLAKACSDFYWFYNIFPEFILTKDRSEIYSISCNDASYSRWGRQNSAGIVEKCYYSANWAEGAKADSAETLVIAALDPFISPEELREKSGFKFIYPVSYPTTGRSFYQLAHWNSLRTSGWLDFANAIPQFKKALMQNVITVKYHIEIADYWWTWKYSDWEQKPELKVARIEDEMSKFNAFVANIENSGKSIFSTFKTDPTTGKDYAGWKITPIGDGLKDGLYIEDSQEASSHLLYSMGVHASLIGSTPGKGMGGGSGSDAREAFNIYQSLCQIHQDLILEPLEFIRDYNGWPSDLVFRFRRPMLQTLDHVPPSKRETKPQTK